MNTHIILLSGGSGKRLWPLSNNIRSKQFLSVLPCDSDGRESMLQRVYRQLRTEFPTEQVVIATGEAQKEQIEAQLGDQVAIVCEPDRRDTFPAIALSSTYIADICHGNPQDIVVVLPVDPYAEQHYFSVVRRMSAVAARPHVDLVLMGIHPTNPSSRFGYMVPKEHQEGFFTIERFVEKPQSEEARRLIEQGACWNGGVFAFRLGYLMEIVQSHIGEYSFPELLDRYASLGKKSFDYAVVEQAAKVAMVPYDGVWRDLGTWDALVQEMGSSGLGLQYLSQTEHTVVVNELTIPVVALGTKNIVVAASADGILVSDIALSAHVKPLVDPLTDSPRSIHYVWGRRTVVDRIMEESTLKSEVRIVEVSAQRVWEAHEEAGTCTQIVLLSGSGFLLTEGEEICIGAGYSTSLARGKPLIIRSSTPMRFVETVVVKK